LADAHGKYLTDPGFPLVVEEVWGGGPWSSTEGVFRILGYPTNHTENSIAFRLETRHGSVGFTGDTGPDPQLGSFMEGVGLLVAECSHPDGNGLATHLTPSSLSEIAGAASPELLVNVHAYPPLDPETVPDLLRGVGYGGRVAAGWDGMGIRVTGGGTRIEEGPG
jgi:ribonuclease BN (tRNA processing enzyme)